MNYEYEGFGSDFETDKFSTHKAYLTIYRKLFAPYKDCLGFCEVGVWDGGSLHMFANYFNKATIFGIDIRSKPECLNNHDRIKFFQKDAYTDPLVISVDDQISVFIDDGGHEPDKQEWACAHYAPILTSDALLIIEDITTPEVIEKLAKSIPSNFKYMGIDLRTSGPSDNYLFVAWNSDKFYE